MNEVVDQWRWTYEYLETEAGAKLYFPRYEFELDSSQSFRNAFELVLGADYAYDVRRVGNAPAEMARERVRFLVVEDSIPALNDKVDAIKAFQRTSGRCKLWSVQAAESGAPTRRWAYVRPENVFEMRAQPGQLLHVPMALEFTRLSDWYASSPTVVTVSGITTTSHTFDVTNPGNLPAKLMVVQVQSNGATGFNAPKLENLTNGYSIQSARVASSTNDEVRIDTGRRALEYSSNGGVSYVSDYANRIIGNNQVLWMMLAPGVNSMRLTNAATPNCNLVMTFSAPFA